MIEYETTSAIIEKWLWTIALVFDAISCIAGNITPSWIIIFLPQFAIIVHFSFKVFIVNNDDD